MSDFISAKEIKEQVSIVDLLSRLGYEPVPRHGREKVYISMIREDDTSPSFTVNDDLGVWFDHGLRKGGNIIDFGLTYWKGLDFNGVLDKIRQVSMMSTSEKRPLRPRKSVKLPHYIVEKVRDIGTHPAITDYLKSRAVFEPAKKYLSEVYYFLEDEKGERKNYFAAGWQNENNGWEVRNKYFKGCHGSKAITFISGNLKKTSVFEGFINFLSWKVEHPDRDDSIIVLNSVALLRAGIEKGKAFSAIDIFFDRDKTGLGATKEFIKALPYASDRSAAYDGFNDYNNKVKADAERLAAAAHRGKDFFSSVKVPFRR
jgi:hypothetical protein